MHVPLLVEQFNDDNGAAEGNGRGEEDRGEPFKAQEARHCKSAKGGEAYLKTAQEEGGFSKVLDFPEAQFEADEEEEEGDAEFRNEFEGMIDRNQPEGGAEQKPREEVAHQ